MRRRQPKWTATPKAPDYTGVWHDGEFKISEYFRMGVLNTHLHYKGRWVMYFHPIFDDPRVLAAKSEEEAKFEAIAIARDIFAQAVDIVNRGRLDALKGLECKFK